MTSLFSYILVRDSGYAPCVDCRMITLATCKPNIRAAARVGDWVMGFHSVSRRPGRADWTPGRLIWLGQVSAIVSPGQYQFYYRGRRDALYERISETEYRRLLPCYHASEANYAKDLRSPVLVFDPRQSWYFGGATPHLLPDEFRELAAGGIGHKRRDVSEATISALKAHLDVVVPDRTFGRPRDDQPFGSPNPGPEIVAYDSRGAGPSDYAYPYAGEGFSIGEDGRVTDSWLMDDED